MRESRPVFTGFHLRPIRQAAADTPISVISRVWLPLRFWLCRRRHPSLLARCRSRTDPLCAVVPGYDHASAHLPNDTLHLRRVDLRMRHEAPVGEDITVFILEVVGTRTSPRSAARQAKTQLSSCDVRSD